MSNWAEKDDHMSQENDQQPNQGGQGNVRPLQLAKVRAPNPHVSDRPTATRHTKEYKGRILQEADQLPHGELNALLRREGLYSSQLSDWRKQRDRAIEQWLEPQRPGPKPEPINPLAAELAKVKREYALLERKLKRAETIIEVQKKIAEILSIPLNPPASEADDF